MVVFVNSEPQTNLLNKDLRTQLSNSSNINRFATAQSARTSDPLLFLKFGIAPLLMALGLSMMAAS
ncbi:hypothetical protein BVC80_8637g5 [Macleaya cordata]|uniref:Uncharacterized protein n=1 Tax=Macleaya cordata TaxID=56857 RepID=A0A200R8Z4_MACCD|nr:hypothetical protein BVC80_8637g5 [Macleaya cordata]